MLQCYWDPILPSTANDLHPNAGCYCVLHPLRRVPAYYASIGASSHAAVYCKAKCDLFCAPVLCSCQLHNHGLLSAAVSICGTLCNTNLAIHNGKHVQTAYVHACTTCCLHQAAKVLSLMLP